MEFAQSLRTFQRVVELGGFTRAAESLGLPKASVSTAVQQLEARLGTQLLHRTTRRVQPTADGRAFYQRSRDVLADLEELQGMFLTEGRQLRGRLRVDMSSGMARLLVLPQLPAFLAEHPQLEIELSATDRLVDVVREGFDCVLRGGTPQDSTLVARPLGVMHIVNCASPAYLARRGTPHGLEDLATHELVHYASVLGQRPSGFEYFDGEAYRLLPMGGAVTVNNVEAYHVAALAGLGIIQVPLLSVRDALARGELVEVVPQLVAEPMPLTLLYARRRHLPRRVRVFMDWLASLLTPHLAPLPRG
ncbi:LysR family transcriptional regulator [Pseudoxanthomonas winnipegensis]|uniref:LysR family transcriptional regulator n=1 Tax=Pseudoxanthomonas winnipegensis TaxID=2480810 RepID=A0A4Q8LAF4_9GAMM|nr:LysR family transcriptional regulator [Pseudoxanthomonas winnipegensis]RZZ82318.1 LysR family transcriptional regulator [Pseudoxanthomonas winnipegensis]TAA25243.1 LysR family transcriptional regulator [Pseudoxanthomonas winnipegensis]TAA39501.1 LysR family transcriptional regulator [Pseudoxanthomonas winnipegensis]TBV74293.1 LysR family transcriptional regulator [Pseudoxanthomonas winnipegensis]